MTLRSVRLRRYLPAVAILASLSGFAAMNTLASPLPTARAASLYPPSVQFDGANNPGRFQSAGLTNATAGAGDIQIRWAWLEPNAPVNGVHTYNWKPFDDELAQWAAHGKRGRILVQYVAYSGQWPATPSWEVGRVPHYTDAKWGTVYPDYFDPTFVGDLQTFVKAIGDHYANSPYRGSIAYVRVGTGVGGEEVPVRDGPSNGPAWSWLQSVGYTPQAWRSWVESRLLDFKGYFSYTTVMNSINTLWYTDGGADPTTGQRGLTLQAEIAYWAAAHGLAIGSQTLSPRYTYAGTPTILHYITAHWPGTFIEFQTTSSVGSLAEVQGDIQTAYCYGGKTIEWYAQVMNNSAYQQAFAYWAQLATGQAQPPAGYCNGL